MDTANKLNTAAEYIKSKTKFSEISETDLKGLNTVIIKTSLIFQYRL